MDSIKEHLRGIKFGILLIILNLTYNNGIWGQQLYPANFDITTLNGTNGFIIPGIDPESQFGAETKFIGDINNDGLEDIAIGVGSADIDGLNLAGAAYIIFGTNTAFSAAFDINTLNGTNGFAVEGLVGSTRMGKSVEGLGDINGDGIDDLAIVYSGTTMVIYGKTTPFNAAFNMDYADGINGFLIQGARTTNEVGALGDINDDDISDFILSRSGSAAWVIFGQSTDFPATINSSWLNGVNGFSIRRYSRSGIPAFLAGAAGDVNNDGINDINIGDWSSSSGSALERTHLVYGRRSFPPELDLETMTVTEGFTVDHSEGDFLAFTGTLGDINNDGIDDFFSEKAAIFGKEPTDLFPAHIPLSSIEDGTYGFVLPGALVSASIGDVNQDGINDFISVYENSRRAFVVFGSTTGFPNPIDETTLNGMNGFVIEGFRGSNIGRPVSGGGDINGDGISDFIVGNPYLSTGRTGEAYVIFGGDHYAMPLNTGYPQATNETVSGFTLRVNGPETGTIHYAILPGNFGGTMDHDAIRNATGTVTSGNFLMDIANTDIDEVISSLTAGTTYDVYLFLEDATGNQGEIYHINDVTTLSSSDTTPPTITCPPDQVLACGDPVPNYIPLLTVTDDIDTSIDVTQDPGPGSKFYDGMTITFTATDDATNSNSCSIQINASGTDTEAPTFNCPSSLTLPCGATIPNYALDPMMNLADNCSETIRWSQTPAEGSTFYDGIEIMVTYTDESGNSDTCVFNVTASTPDVEAPIVTCPATQYLNCGDLIPDYSSLLSVTDNCSATVSYRQDPAAGTVFTGDVRVTAFVEDPSGNGNSCSFLVEANPDTDPPTFSCIADQSLSCGTVVPDYTGLMTVTDNCDASPRITQNPAVGSAFTDGMEVIMTVSDASGNSDTCRFTINKSPDTAPPTFSCIADQSLSCGTVVPDYTGLMTVTDNCDASPRITQTPAVGSAFTDGMEIIMTVSDASGNSDTCRFTINESPDTSPPTFSCIPDQSLSCSTVVPNYTGLMTVTDNCDASPRITQTPAVGSAFTDGMEIIMTVSDASGNSDTCRFTINESPDTSPPTFSCIPDQSSSCSAVVPDYTGLMTVTDNCDASPRITQTPAAGSAFTDGMEVIMTVSDASGNSDTCRFTINESPDTAPPTFSCIADQSLSCGAVVPDYIGLMTVTDNCDASPRITQTPAVGSPFTDGMEVIMTVSDASGNSDTCRFTINESPDVEDPVITTCLDDQNLATGSTLPDYTTRIAASDNCDSDLEITQSPRAGTAFIANTTLVITVTDDYGNTAACDFEIVIDRVDPIVCTIDAGENLEIVERQATQLNAIISASNPGTLQWSPSEGLSHTTIANPIANPTETTTYTLRFTNDEGCIAEDTITVFVTPLEADETKYGFSPDGDGINEYWEIDGIDNYPNNKVLIYNRWGDLVFEATGYNNTSKAFRGIANRKRNLGADILPEGTYFFHIKIDGTHHLKKETGFLVLKR